MSSIILISASMDYDQSWNDWVDERFNLNHKNAQFKRRMTDYADVESQQDWINMLSRDLFLDEMYLLITLAALIITVFHTLSRVNNNLIVRPPLSTDQFHPHRPQSKLALLLFHY